MNSLFGLLLAGLVSGLAWRLGALSPSGALAAALSGGLVFGLGGLSWAVLLLAFFISSSALSRLFRQRKVALNEKYSKGSQRDWGQVLANGGLGAVLALLHAALPAQDWVWVAFAGAMAAVNGDTWATELGVLSRADPRLITSGKRVERGTSGGVTLLGWLVVLAGAGLIGLAAVLAAPPASPAPLFAGALLGGLAGSFFDSLLGATLQAIYYCPACRKETERTPRHTCGAGTLHRRGWAWLNNDWVNFACSAAGAAVSVGVWSALV